MFPLIVWACSRNFFQDKANVNISTDNKNVKKHIKHHQAPLSSSGSSVSETQNHSYINVVASPMGIKPFGASLADSVEDPLALTENYQILTPEVNGNANGHVYQSLTKNTTVWMKQPFRLYHLTRKNTVKYASFALKAYRITIRRDIKSWKIDILTFWNRFFEFFPSQVKPEIKYMKLKFLQPRVSRLMLPVVMAKLHVRWSNCNY